MTPPSGVGGGRITFSASANTTGATRSATMSIAGRPTVVRQAAVASTLAITTTSLPAGRVDLAYSASLAATGGVGTVTWTLAGGTLPAGLLLGATGTITGTVTVAGTTSFSVRATDAASATATRDLSVVIIEPSAPVLAPAVVDRPTVSLRWTPSATGAPPAIYTIVASLTPGGPLVAQLPVGATTAMAVAAPDGTFFVRVLAW